MLGLTESKFMIGKYKFCALNFFFFKYHLHEYFSYARLQRAVNVLQEYIFQKIILMQLQGNKTNTSFGAK